MGHYFKPIMTVGLRIIGSYFAWMRKYAKHQQKYPLETRFKRLKNLLIAVNKSFNAVFKVFGQENLPKDENFCIISNHLSNYDPLAYICTMDKPLAFVSKKEAEKFPFVGKCCKTIDCLFMDRKDLKQSLKVMMAVQKDLEEKKKNWAIFAEGTRNKDPLAALREMHAGTFRPAVKSKTTIVPAVILGAQRLLKRKPVFKKYPVIISYLKPMKYEDYQKYSNDELAKLVRQEIQKELTYHVRPLYHQLMLKYNPKKYRFNLAL